VCSLESLLGGLQVRNLRERRCGWLSRLTFWPLELKELRILLKKLDVDSWGRGAEHLAATV
jgi:hypothetical protein